VPENLGKLLRENVNPRSTLLTDGLSFYKKPGEKFARHEAVDHSLGEYVRGDAHINTAEVSSAKLKSPHGASESPRHVTR
jgi:ISXO2-like transposase domain